MIQIAPGEVTPDFVSLLNRHTPTVIRAFAVLAGGNVGRIFVDDPIQPGSGFVWEADDGTLYPAGQVTRAALAEVISLLRRDALVALGFRDGDAATLLFPPDPNAGAECLEFDRPRGTSDLSPFLSSLPDGFTACRMDRPLLERSPKHEDLLHRYGSFENFLERGIAVGILHGDAVICEACADMPVNGVRELGITTQPAYRRQGFAATACAHLIRLCEDRGEEMYWDCARLNIGSVSLARSLGFRSERAYKRLAWFPPQALH